MSQSYSLFVQQKTEVGWIVPTEVAADSENPCARLGEFAWFRRSDVTLHRLFLCEGALLPLRKEMAPDLEGSPLYEERIHGYEYGYYGWLPFDELLLHEWSETFLYVARHVPVQLAPLFEDGSLPFPTRSLLDAGLTEERVEELRSTSGENDITLGERGGGGIDVLDAPIYQWARAPDVDGVTRVTWRVSVHEFIGEWMVARLLSLQKLAAGDDLRIICLFSG